MGTVISRMILPDEKQQQVNLYYRCHGNAEVRDHVFLISSGTAVSLDTYFNALAYSKYMEYSTIRSVSFSLKMQGRAKISLKCTEVDALVAAIETRPAAGGAAVYMLGPVPLNRFPPGGLLYLHIDAEEDCVVLEGRFETEEFPANEVSLVAVICTYHRETYVRRNLNAIRETVWDDKASPICNNLDVIVVDNGSSLAVEEHDHLKIYPNKNYGGSGGFARGMIEAIRCGRNYTHVLFMDDDISFEPEILLRTAQILKYADRPYCIGGEMLLEKAPDILYEAGGFYVNGRLKAASRGIKISVLQELLDSNRENSVHYNAWWYCCVPMEDVKRVGLPMPFFIKEDDVEYGIRLGRKFLTMNGIGVWHKAFSDKYSPHLEYYIKRNELIVSAIYGIYDGVIKSMWKLSRGIGKNLIKGDLPAAHFICLAYLDFLNGPAFFYRKEADKLNEELLRERESLLSDSRLQLICNTLGLYFKIAMGFIFDYKNVKKQFQIEHSNLTGFQCWCEWLSIMPLTN